MRSWLLLAAALEAAVVRGPFAPAPPAWGPALRAAVAAAAPGSSACAGLSRLDPLKPGHAPSFEPLTRALTALGQSPARFAALPESARAEAVVRAARAAEDEVRARVGDEAQLPRLAVTHRMYLDEVSARRVDKLYAEALRRDAEGKLARARSAAEQWLSTGELEAGEPAPVLAFDPYRKRRKKPAALELDRRNPGLHLAMLMRGVEPGGPLPAPSLDPLLDPFEKALSLASAKLPAGRNAYFAEAWAPAGKEQAGRWRFVFYGLGGRWDRRGHRVDVAFVGGRPAATVTPDAEVARGHSPFPLSRSLLARGTGWSLADARRILGQRLPPQDIGLTVSLVMRSSVEGDDLWYVFKGPQGELGAVNGRTGQSVSPAAPAEPGWWQRVLAWWRARR